MRYLGKSIISTLLLLSFLTSCSSQSLESQFDKLLSEKYLPETPGAAALVAIDGKVVYHKAFGMANMELQKALQPDMVFEIGSITKQFTSVAILMLMEEGKLSLDDEITKFLPDYPTQDHTITVHHLLTHTSGIKSYTSMRDWMPLWRKDFKPLEMIDFFKNEPMDFAPGEKFLYNNSAYFILGYIIEKLSGMSYEEFIQSKIFNAVGMKASYYASHSRIIPDRASGYQDNDGFKNADYLSMTQPYSAGSLMSTVHDLFLWNRAMRSNQLIKKESKELAFTNYELNNREKIGYGYGWFVKEFDGYLAIQHAGGIFGYIANSIYMPDEDVFVAVFTNCDCNEPISVSTEMAKIAVKGR